MLLNFLTIKSPGGPQGVEDGNMYLKGCQAPLSFFNFLSTLNCFLFNKGKDNIPKICYFKKECALLCPHVASNVLYKQNLRINAIIHNNKIHWETFNMSSPNENTHHTFPEPSLILVFVPTP